MKRRAKVRFEVVGYLRYESDEVTVDEVMENIGVTVNLSEFHTESAYFSTVEPSNHEVDIDEEFDW